MRWIVVALVSLMVFAGECRAESCKTCRGVACRAKEISEKDCDHYVPALPFESQLMFNGVDDSAQYGCLDVQYYIGKSVEHIRQCILSNDLNSYCQMLENSLAVKSCQVESTSEVRNERSISLENILAENEEDVTNGDDDDAETTTSDGVIPAISISCFIAIFSALLF